MEKEVCLITGVGPGTGTSLVKTFAQRYRVAMIARDAAIDLEWTRVALPDKPDEFFARPEDIAAECFHVAHQPPSTWTFDVVIRPFGENW